MKSMLFIVLAASALPASASAGVFIPPGYYLQVLMPPEAGFSNWVSMNNHGEVVWSTRLGGSSWSRSEIFYYDGEIVQQLTDDNIRDDFPSINDEGTIVWSRADGPNGVLQIVRLRDGTLDYLIDESAMPTPGNNTVPVINNNGVVVWDRDAEPLCSLSDSEIWIYDDAGGRQLSDLGFQNTMARINDDDVIVWTQYDFCASPWRSVIYRYADGIALAISGDQIEPQRVAISNTGFVTWTYREPSDPAQPVVAGWRGGVLSRIIDDGLGGNLNDSDQLLYIAQPPGEPWNIRLYDGGLITQITNDDFWNIEGDINNFGEMVWRFREFPNTGVRGVFRRGQGDLNCDGAITASDISPFVTAVVNADAYADLFPDCDAMLADLNEDSRITVGDIAPFVSALLAGR